MRAEFAQAMIALFQKRRDLVFITGDLGYMALEGVAETYAERFINAGIAEQNAVSLAAAGYPTGRYGSQRWHQEESGLAGQALRSHLAKVMRG
jgi:transketolase C-terminal domain/subunit